MVSDYKLDVEKIVFVTLDGFELLARQCHLVNSDRIDSLRDFPNGLPHGTTCQLSCMNGNRFTMDDLNKEN